MIESHVTGPASLRRPCLFQGEGVPSMAGIAGRIPKPLAGLRQSRNLFRRFDPNFMASSAALHPFRHGHGLIVNCWHGFHRGPGDRVLALLELLQAVCVALPTGLGCRYLCFRSVLGCGVVTSMAGFTTNAQTRMLTQFPVVDDVGCSFRVTLDTLLGSRGRREFAKLPCGQARYSAHTENKENG